MLAEVLVGVERVCKVYEMVCETACERMSKVSVFVTLLSMDCLITSRRSA